MERLKTNYNAKMKEEESASEITVEEISELDALICLIIKQERMAEEARQANVNWKKMMLTRQQRRCERLNRSEEEDNTEKSPEKESGGDAVEFPREKAQMEKELRWEE
ncbi:unnamed protein product, partial [Porites evermanni]